ncbi:hypothetical protein BV898_14953 [Hypsibius exemplaris]|uniref:Uncharacterized protein n=1 Tax=Hypsibius exemplaris TaxID=2072580 RepID=A0A9X6RK94_HYPEX|nr:hypothetical protein BV898_14953 [Hypsibius exemplaris]
MPGCRTAVQKPASEDSRTKVRNTSGTRAARKERKKRGDFIKNGYLKRSGSLGKNRQTHNHNQIVRKARRSLCSIHAEQLQTTPLTNNTGAGVPFERREEQGDNVRRRKFRDRSKSKEKRNKRRRKKVSSCLTTTTSTTLTVSLKPRNSQQEAGDIIGIAGALGTKKEVGHALKARRSVEVDGIQPMQPNTGAGVPFERREEQDSFIFES